MDFSDERLAAAVGNYNPSIHESPIVVGHPKTDDPAFGWVKALEFKEGQIYAVPDPDQLNEDFEEMVKKGSFKKVSASWYLPDSPNNPVPGELYLRHVGFLGAQAPAIKGLENIQFSEEQDTIEFSDMWAAASSHNTIARAFKNMREFIIDKFSKDDADGVIPSYLPEELERASENMFKQAEEAERASKPDNLAYNEDTTVTLEELKAANVKLQADLDAEKTTNESLNDKVASFEEQVAADKKAAIASKVDALITAGKAVPAQRDQLIAFAEALEDSGTSIEFGEGDDKKSFAGADAFMQFLSNNKAIDFSERSKDGDEPTIDSLTPKQIAAKAEKLAKDEGISFNEAVTTVMKDAE